MKLAGSIGVTAIALFVGTSQANACASGAKCVAVPTARQTVAAFKPGDILPQGRYQMMLNTSRYGLPPVNGAWRYFKVDYDIYRIENGTFQVLERVTHLANRSF